MDVESIARAFSGHRFAEAYDHLADGVRWTNFGGPVYEGRAAVVAACEQTAEHLASTTVHVRRFVVIANDGAAAVDTLTEYVSADGDRHVIASCDLYEAADGLVISIRSYTVEVDAPSDG